MSWCLILLVFGLEVDPFLNEVFADVVSLQLDSIEDGTLELVVEVVMIGAVVHQDPSSFHVSFSHTVEDACLAVLVFVINITASINEQLAYRTVSFSRCVEQWDLLEVIVLGCICTHIEENLTHLE